MKMKTFSALFLLVFLICQYSAIPNPSEKAKMGRYILHNVDWIAISTISTLPSFENYPFVNLKSVADGPPNNGTGFPYLLMTDLDLSGKDIKVDNRVTILASLAEVNYCASKNYDPQDPRCGRLILTGKLNKVTVGTDEFRFAHSAIITKHPIMAEWEKVHQFYLAKLIIEQVCVLDYFGGAAFVPVEEYLQAGPGKPEENEQKTLKTIKNDIHRLKKTIAVEYVE